ncbi:substrate-binding domain-containing protein [Acidisoma silvae]|uniref:Substrate-binding domain-containing protein n=1 Tax=Acidisoma silvae TaxID=2802396 RepID=A0A964E066_9PROT|nr:substrate-binding domain-containing protein [Acidisoma silvae]MCB8877021.1 substrate-binding domain-containing protein [Acidisoma silvae]
MGGSAAQAAGLAGAPAPFDHGGVTIAVVNYLSGSDFLQAYEAGAARQGHALGATIRLSEAQQDPSRLRALVQQAIDLHVQGIVINNGTKEALRDVVQKALAAGIKVVTYDLDLGLPGVPVVEQNDREMANIVLAQALKDNGDHFKAGEVYVAGFLPLDHRNAAYRAILAAHPGIKNEAVWGIVNSTTPASVADQTQAVFRAHPDITVVFTPWDEFARGVKLGLDESNLSSKVRIYGVDTSTSDIQAMREPNSPWVASAATNAAVVGEVSVRAVALLIAGQNPGAKIDVNPHLITRDELLKNDIKTIQELAEKDPDFRQSDAATAAWIPSVATK